MWGGLLNLSSTIGTHTRLMLNTKYEFDHERPAIPDTTSGREDVCLYLACEDADVAYRELGEKGWKDMQAPSTAYYGMRQLYLKDPDGFMLCLQHPAPASSASVATT